MSHLAHFRTLVKRSGYLISILVVSALFTACGGGGGGGGGGGPTTFTISGSIDGGGVIDLVMITLSGDSSNMTTTNASGNYSFSGLDDGNYTMTPSLTDHTFSPASVAVVVSGGNITASSITSLGVISGTLSGSTFASVTVNLSGATTASTTTDGSGNYQFSGINLGSNTIAPTDGGTAYAPVSTLVTYTGAASLGNDFFGTAETLVTVSGTVTGDVVANVPVALTYSVGGAAVGDAVTDGSGNYSFAGLADGTDYTVTPSRTDYTFAPLSVPTGVLAADSTGNDFVSANDKPQATGYDVTGTVSYAGAEAGNIYIRLGGMYGTTINAAGAYTIRGVPDGSYDAVAYMDHLDIGVTNAANPVGTSTTFVVSGGAAVANISLTDPAAPTVVAPGAVLGFPSEQSAVVAWDAPVDGSDIEIADSYDLYWNTTSTVGPANNIGSALGVPAVGGDSSGYFATGLTNGQVLYFGIRARVGATVSGVVVSPAVTVGPVAGGSSVSGTVTHPVATGPMIVALVAVDNFDTGIAGLEYYFTHIASPTSPQSYTISGVPDGTYLLYAFIDMNSNGYFDQGDIPFFDGINRTITVSGNVSSDIMFPDAAASFTVITAHYGTSMFEGYALSLGASGTAKRIIAMTVTAGPGIETPMDVASNGGFSFVFFSNMSLPVVGDQYDINVTYHDASSETLSAAVTGVLGDFPTGMSVSSSTTPTYSWTAPASAPSPYSYNLYVYETSSFTDAWFYTLPSTATSVVHNVDGNADIAPLLGATTYTFFLDVADRYGNGASYSIDFLTP